VGPKEPSSSLDQLWQALVNSAPQSVKAIGMTTKFSSSAFCRFKHIQRIHSKTGICACLRQLLIALATRRERVWVLNAYGY
jgi:hypothetical protein